MLPKTAISWRPIALLHMLYRWWMKMLRGSVAAWDADNSGPWDAAVKGKGCEQGSFEEEATTELHLLAGGITAGLLLDLEKFV